jgi:S-adenosylmethionine synthetase
MKLSKSSFDVQNNVYTVETVLKGHPDKVCDQICDSILDECLEQDSLANTTIECMGTSSTIFIGGEMSTNANVDICEIAHKVYADIGYTERLDVINKVHKESAQTNNPVKTGIAGDQGIMYGYACESEFNYLPYGVMLVNELAREIDIYRNKTYSFLPDGKVQATIISGNIDTLVVSVQHSDDVSIQSLKQLICDNVITKFIPINEINNFFFNHNSHFVQGGFSIDAGLSGRKIIADTYCGTAPHGGGSFSGKDPSRLDRSGAYMARFIAKNVVSNGLAKECKVAIAYIFGSETPVMIDVQTTPDEKENAILTMIIDKFDFRPNAIIERLGLREMKYCQTAVYGHFTNPHYPWEELIDI